MTATILIGAQWGDEGKGRVADWLASESDIVARYAGGDNAGHTVYVGEQVYKLHLIPSGILREHVICVLGNGTVINPVNLMREIEQLKALGVDVSPERLRVSTRAHIITPAHIALDRANEAARGKEAIGTTLRGIGPAYLDKTGRQGLRMGDMQDMEGFADRLHAAIERARAALQAQGLTTDLDPQAAAESYLDAADYLKPYLHDTSRYLNERLMAGAHVLCEGAQGTMLDVDHGDYPFVTSSSPTAGGALIGLGFGPRHVERVVGVAKAYSTRVGAGPMPTELEGALGDRLRGTGENFWDEFGTTTGRPRRCGWLDVVMLRYAAQINGMTDMVITKLDVLSGFGEIKLAVAYDIDGVRHDYPPDSLDLQKRAQPIYETLPGWHEDLSGVRQWDELPEAARSYIHIISEQVGMPVYTVSVGPEREQLVHG